MATALTRSWTADPSGVADGRLHQDDAGSTVTFTGVPHDELAEAVASGTVRAYLYSRDTGALHKDAVVPDADCDTTANTVEVGLDVMDVAYNGRYRLVVRLLDAGGETLAESDSHACPIRVYGEGVYRTWADVQALVSGVVADTVAALSGALAAGVALLRGSTGAGAVRAAERALTAVPATAAERVPGATLQATAVYGVLVPIGDPVGDEDVAAIAALRWRIKPTGAVEMTYLRSALLHDALDDHDPDSFVLLGTGTRRLVHPLREGKHWVALDRRCAVEGKLYARLEADGPFQVFGVTAGLPFAEATYGPSYYKTTSNGAYVAAATDVNVAVEVGDMDPDDPPTVEEVLPTQELLAATEVHGIGPPPSQIQAALDALGEAGLGAVLRSVESYPEATCRWGTPEGVDIYGVQQRVRLEDVGGAIGRINGLRVGFSAATGAPITEALVCLTLDGPDEDRPTVGGRVLAMRGWRGHVGQEERVRAFRFRPADVPVNDPAEHVTLTLLTNAPLQGFGTDDPDEGDEVRIRTDAVEHGLGSLTRHDRPDLAVSETAYAGAALYVQLIEYGSPEPATDVGIGHPPRYTTGVSAERTYDAGQMILETGALPDHLAWASKGASVAGNAITQALIDRHYELFGTLGDAFGGGVGMVPCQGFLSAQVGDGTFHTKLDPRRVFEVASITRSGTTATLTTVLPHGHVTGEQVAIEGAEENNFNGDAKGVTVTGATTLTYAVANSGAASATPGERGIRLRGRFFTCTRSGTFPSPLLITDEVNNPTHPYAPDFRVQELQATGGGSVYTVLNYKNDVLVFLLAKMPNAGSFSYQVNGGAAVVTSLADATPQHFSIRLTSADGLTGNGDTVVFGIGATGSGDFARPRFLGLFAYDGDTANNVWVDQHNQGSRTLEQFHAVRHQINGAYLQAALPPHHYVTWFTGQSDVEDDPNTWGPRLVELFESSIGDYVGRWSTWEGDGTGQAVPAGHALLLAHDTENFGRELAAHQRRLHWHYVQQVEAGFVDFFRYDAVLRTWYGDPRGWIPDNVHPEYPGHDLAMRHFLDRVAYPDLGVAGRLALPHFGWDF